MSPAVKLLLITNIVTLSLLGFAFLRVRYFRHQYNKYYDKYSEVYTEYKEIKAELDSLKKKVVPDGGRGGWFRDEPISEDNNE